MRECKPCSRQQLISEVTLMSTSAVSSSSLYSQLGQYFQTRQSDLKQLGQALQSGDLASAQAAYNNIASLGQNGPFAGGESVSRDPDRSEIRPPWTSPAVGRFGWRATSFRIPRKRWRPRPPAARSA